MLQLQLSSKCCYLEFNYIGLFSRQSNKLQTPLVSKFKVLLWKEELFKIIILKLTTLLRRYSTCLFFFFNYLLKRNLSWRTKNRVTSLQRWERGRLMLGTWNTASGVLSTSPAGNLVLCSGQDKESLSAGLNFLIWRPWVGLRQVVCQLICCFLGKKRGNEEMPCASTIWELLFERQLKIFFFSSPRSVIYLHKLAFTQIPNRQHTKKTRPREGGGEFHKAFHRNTWKNTTT